ncbi:MAG: N-glycosylase/DNA lyase [Candidatus Methanosuratus sp.]|nr:N-glycosylase/DNA lyase [Candidatus Methanosuratincola sp.]
MPISTKTEEAIEKFNRLHSKEVYAEAVEESLRRLRVFFGGGVAESCCAADYFEELAVILEEAHDVAYAAWSSSVSRNREPGFVVIYARLDFLEELRQVIEEVRPSVDARMREFEAIGGRMDPDEIFSELCFCILTANYTAEGGIRIQRALGQHFRSKPMHELVECLRSLGHRFPNKRAEFICGARQLYGGVLQALKMEDFEAREWLVENVRGLGYKEASHFLRNIGRKDLAIIDRHILHFLDQKGLIDSIPRTLSRMAYLSIERLLSAIARSMNVSLAELDLYLWYVMTGKVLK